MSTFYNTWSELFTCYEHNITKYFYWKLAKTRVIRKCSLKYMKWSLKLLNFGSHIVN